MNEMDTGFTVQTFRQTERLDTDDALQVLADPHRRAVVSSLLDQEAGTFEDELVDDVLQEAVSSTGNRTEIRSRVATRLQHAHLPKLADVGLIEWDRNKRFVEPTDSLSALEPLLDVAPTL